MCVHTYTHTQIKHTHICLASMQYLSVPPSPSVAFILEHSLSLIPRWQGIIPMYHHVRFIITVYF